MTHEEVTRWSAIEHQGHLRYGQTILMECLFGIIDGRTVDEFGFDLELRKEIERANAWQEHNAVAARYAMKELFALIDAHVDAAEIEAVPMPVYLEAAE